MDGLECSEIMLSKTLTDTSYFRLEAEYYNAKGFFFPRLISGASAILGVQYGTSKICDENQTDYPVLRLNELQNGFIEKPQKYCHILSKGEYDALRLKKGDVLIIRTNGNPDLVGQAAVVMEDTNYAFASYLFRVFLNGMIDPCSLVAYLNGKYGRMEIDKNSMKGNQTNFSPAKFRDISIPRLDTSLQDLIGKVFGSAYEYRLRSGEQYSRAERLLEMHLGVNGIPEHMRSYSVRSLSASLGRTGRLDAEYYQPKYDDLHTLLQAFPTSHLGGADGIVTISKSIEPGSEYYGDTGIPFIRVSDISKTGIAAPSVKIPKTIVPSIETLYPKKDTILFSKDGSVGIAFKVEDDMQAVTSGALLHLRIKDTGKILPDYLTLVLNSPIVQLQAERDTSGAIIQHWKTGDVEDVIVPILPYDVQAKISEEVQASFSSRRRSKQLTDAAVRAVEIAIEQDEATAAAWLENKAGSIMGTE